MSPEMSISPGDRYNSLFQTYAAWDRTHDGAWVPRPTPLDWTLLKRQAQAESNLNPDAVSPVGAEGLSQFMRATFEEWAQKQFKGPPPPSKHVSPFDPEDAIWAQADVMGWLLGVWKGDVRKALSSYNFGIGNVTRLIQAKGEAWETDLPAETQAYLAKILVPLA